MDLVIRVFIKVNSLPRHALTSRVILSKVYIMYTTYNAPIHSIKLYYRVLIRKLILPRTERLGIIRLYNI